MKVCNSCLLTKPVEQFHSNGGALLRPQCKDCECKRKATYRRTNAESVRKSRKAYYLTHRQQVLASNQNYRFNNPDACAARYARRRAQKLAAFVADVSKLELFNRDKGLCCLCGIEVPLRDAHLEHLTPLSRGGTHEPNNCGLAHPACNLAKHAKTAEEFIPAWRIAKQAEACPST